MIAQEESYWRQSANVYWLRTSDINSSFSHPFATTRKKINSIFFLTLDDGMIVIDHNDLCNVANSYFHNLYCCATIDFDEVINCVPI